MCGPSYRHLKTERAALRLRDLSVTLDNGTAVVKDADVVIEPGERNVDRSAALHPFGGDGIELWNRLGVRRGQAANERKERKGKREDGKTRKRENGKTGRSIGCGQSFSLSHLPTFPLSCLGSADAIESATSARRVLKIKRDASERNG